MLPDKQHRLRHRTEFPTFGCTTRAKVQAWVSGDSTLLDGISVRIDDRQLDKAEIKSVSRCPNNSGNSPPVEFQFPPLFLLIAIKQSRDFLGRSGQPDTADVIVDLL